MKSLIERLGGKLRYPREPLKERIAKALYRLNVQLEKLEQKSSRLEQRDKEIFERCIGANLAKDYARAAIYANECAEIRMMAKIVISAELALERVILRLQTIEEIGDVLAQMTPVVGVVKETRGKLAGVIPEVASELGDINSMLNNTLLEAGETKPQPVDVEISSEVAKAVLEEANAVADQKIKERFPELPELALTERFLEPALTESSLEPPVPAPITTGNPEVTIEAQVYDYIRERGGELNLSQCATDLNVSSEDVKKVLEKLQDKGKINLQQESPTANPDF